MTISEFQNALQEAIVKYEKEHKHAFCVDKIRGYYINIIDAVSSPAYSSANTTSGYEVLLEAFVQEYKDWKISGHNPKIEAILKCELQVEPSQKLDIAIMDYDFVEEPEIIRINSMAIGMYQEK